MSDTKSEGLTADGGWQTTVQVRQGIPIFFALLFYGFIALAGFLWMYFTSDKSPLTYFDFPKGARLTLGVGIGLGLAIVALTAVFAKIFPWVKVLEEEFGKALAGQKKIDLPIIAFLSGAGEEVFFRGGMQTNIGLVLTSIIFGVIHFPPNMKFIVWPIFAMITGFILGWEFQYTGSLVAPILTHFLVNLIHLFKITHNYKNGLA